MTKKTEKSKRKVCRLSLFLKGTTEKWSKSIIEPINFLDLVHFSVVFFTRHLTHFPFGPFDYHVIMTVLRNRALPNNNV